MVRSSTLRTNVLRLIGLPLALFLWAACDMPLAPADLATDVDVEVTGTSDAPEVVPCLKDLPYATELVHYIPGEEAGYGQDEMPGVTLGPPLMGPPTSGSLDVLSLGLKGEIVLGFSGKRIVDGPGPDFIVWENAFWVGGNSDNPYAELGEVAVSEDGETWHVFPCDPERADGYDTGCAGWRPRQEFDACALVPIEPEVVGGDPYDLADLGLTDVKYVRIRDVSGVGGAPSAGFDLDAVGAVHLE